jgi:hypothetical protein
MTQQQDRPMSIKKTISSAFQLAKDAARIRDALELHLATISPGREHQLLHHCHRHICDFVVAFGHLEDQIATMRAVNPTLLTSGR